MICNKSKEMNFYTAHKRECEMKMKRKTIVCLLTCAAAVLLFRSGPVREIYEIPDHVILYQGEKFSIENTEILCFGSGAQNVSADANPESVFQEYAKAADGTIHARTQIRFLGITVKDVEVTIRPEKCVNPGGHCIGVALYTNGIILSGYSDITYEQGKKRNPALEAGLQEGDIITHVNGTAVGNARDMGRILSKYQAEPIQLTIMRNQKSMQISITPVYDIYEKQYRLGLWLRDSTAGIGTLTFSDRTTKEFAALGHAICDPDTGIILPVKSGEIVQCVINEVKQGQKGIPGELKGSFHTNAPAYGKIMKNTEYGLYGVLFEDILNELYPEGIEVASRNSVSEGKATILSTIDGNGVQEFEIEIVKANKQQQRASKSMVIQVTDERLLRKTGGIVQGMSGSPIIQNGKLIGAVTHVLISDPTKGYGLYVDWME